MRAEQKVNRRYSYVLLHYPWILFGVVSAISVVMIVTGIVRSELPDFSDPSKGFYCRGSDSMMGRLMIMRELGEQLRAQMGKTTTVVEPKPGVDACEDDASEPIMQSPEFDDECLVPPSMAARKRLWPAVTVSNNVNKCLLYGTDVVELDLQLQQVSRVLSRGSSPLKFNRCSTSPPSNQHYEMYFEIKNTTSFQDSMRALCVQDHRLHAMFTDGDQQPPECHYSLPGIAADLFSQPNCFYLTDHEIEIFEFILKACQPLASNGILRQVMFKRAYVAYRSLCNHVCFSPAMYTALDQLMDIRAITFERTNDADRSVHLRYSAIILTPSSLSINNGSRSQIHANATWDLKRLEKELSLRSANARLVAVNMANSRIFVAMQNIKLDMYLIVLAISSIVAISLIYTRSLVVCTVTILNVIMALGCAYCTYKLLFRITMFPFINLIGSFLLIGLSCDNVFVYDDIWLTELQGICPEDGKLPTSLDIIGSTLRHAVAALFITSCTTSAAFLTNMLSSIVYIQLFGLYLGISIAFLFLFSVSILPAVLVITHRALPAATSSECHGTMIQLNELSSKLTDQEQPHQQNPISSPARGMAEKRQLPDLCQTPTVSLRLCKYLSDVCNWILPKPYRSSSPAVRKPSFLGSSCWQRMLHIADKMKTTANTIVFHRLLPFMIIDHTKVLLFLFTLFGITGMVAVFGWPRMKSPQTNRQRFFRQQTHLMENFEFNLRDNIRAYVSAEIEETSYPDFIFVWGVKGKDKARILDPESKPILISMDDEDPEFSVFAPSTIAWLDNMIKTFLSRSDLFVETDTLLNQWNLYKLMLSNRDANASTPDVVCFSEHLCLGPEHDVQEKAAKLLDMVKSGDKKLMIPEKPRIFFLSNAAVRAIGFISCANATFTRYDQTQFYLKHLEDQFTSFKMKGPEKYRHGWFVSPSLAVFDLQTQIARGTYSSLIAAVVIVAFALLLTTANFVISLFAIVAISFILADTIAVFVLFGWTLNFMETIIIITAVGLSVDFTVHYGVAFLHAPDNRREVNSGCCIGQSTSVCRRGNSNMSVGQKSKESKRRMTKEDLAKKRENNVRVTLCRVGPAVMMAALTTFLAGFAMSPSKLSSFSQMGLFLMLIMMISWAFATFFFLPLCLLYGPTDHWGTIRWKAMFTNCCGSNSKDTFPVSSGELHSKKNEARDAVDNDG